MDFAKRLLDYGYHAPTTYFPLLIPECLLIEPTETESRQEIDGFVEAMKAILAEAKNTPELVTSAPLTMPVIQFFCCQVNANLRLILSYRFVVSCSRELGYIRPRQPSCGQLKMRV